MDIVDDTETEGVTLGLDDSDSDAVKDLVSVSDTEDVLDGEAVTDDERVEVSVAVVDAVPEIEIEGDAEGLAKQYTTPDSEPNTTVSLEPIEAEDRIAEPTG
jgi:hypothetical protein